VTILSSSFDAMKDCIEACAWPSSIFPLLSYLARHSGSGSKYSPPFLPPPPGPQRASPACGLLCNYRRLMRNPQAVLFFPSPLLRKTRAAGRFSPFSRLRVGEPLSSLFFPRERMPLRFFFPQSRRPFFFLFSSMRSVNVFSRLSFACLLDVVAVTDARSFFPFPLFFPSLTHSHAAS